MATYCFPPCRNQIGEKADGHLPAVQAVDVPSPRAARARQRAERFGSGKLGGEGSRRAAYCAYQFSAAVAVRAVTPGF